MKAYVDKGASKQLAAKLEVAQAQGEQGLVDVYKAHKARGLKEHVDDWVAHLRTAGRDPKYVANAEHRLSILIEACGWNALPAIEPNGFLRWREQAKKTPRNGTEKGRETVSATTLNQYLDTCRAFLNWCAKTKRCPSNPLACIDKVEGAKVRVRRALSDEQVSALLAAAPESRRLVYRFGLATGLRRSEIEDLQWGDVRLAAIPFAIQLRAEATKARRGDRIYIPATLADDLRKHRPTNAGDADPVFVEVPCIEDWRSDLAAAEIPYRDGQGRTVDFHAGTRKTLCTRLNRKGVPLAQAMRIMRHTDIRLTSVDYVDDSQLGTEQVILPEPVTGTAQAPKQATAGA
jgi:integrase